MLNNLQRRKLNGKPTKTQAIQLKHKDIKAAAINMHHMFKKVREIEL